MEFPEFNPQAIDRESVKYVVTKLVDTVINSEFKGDGQKTTFKAGESLDKFFDRLEEKYTDKVISLIKEATNL